MGRAVNIALNFTGIEHKFANDGDILRKESKGRQKMDNNEGQGCCTWERLAWANKSQP